MQSKLAVRSVALLALSLVACSAPEHSDKVKTFLAGDARADARDRALTGAWTSDEGDRILLVHAGDLVAVMPMGGATRAWMHFGEGHLDGQSLSLLPYRQGVGSESSVGGLEVANPRESTLDQEAGTLTFADGSSWSRSASVPGDGDLAGIWRTPSHDLVAIAHEGDRLLACALDASVRERFTVAYGRVGDDDRLWTVLVRDGRPGARKIANVSSDRERIEWPDGEVWKLEEHLQGAPPAPPRPQSPADRGALPNSSGGTLSWAFDWTDVAGATEYRIEIVQEDAPRAFLEKAEIGASEFVLTRNGGSLARTEGWSWRVAAKVGGEWTEWSPRARFRVE